MAGELSPRSLGPAAHSVGCARKAVQRLSCFAYRLVGRDHLSGQGSAPNRTMAQVGRTRLLLRGTRKPGESGDVSGSGARALVADYSPTEPETPGLLTRSSSWLNDGFLNRERTTPFLTD